MHESGGEDQSYGIDFHGRFEGRVFSRIRENRWDVKIVIEGGNGYNFLSGMANLPLVMMRVGASRLWS